MLTRAVMGHGWFYYLTIGSVLLVLALSANTAFADFPRLTRAIALDDYMPHVFLLARPPPALLLGHLRPRRAHRHPADRLPRRHRPPDSALRHRRIHGLHPFAGRHGDALEAQGRQRSADVSSTAWAPCHRHHHHRRAGGQIHRGRLDHRAAGRPDDPVHAPSSATTPRRPRNRLDRPISPAEVTEPIVIVPIDRWSRIYGKGALLRALHVHRHSLPSTCRSPTSRTRFCKIGTRRSPPRSRAPASAFPSSRFCSRPIATSSRRSSITS